MGLVSMYDSFLKLVFLVSLPQPILDFWMLVNFLCIGGGRDGVGCGVVVMEVASAESVTCGMVGVSELLGNREDEGIEGDC
ncbi:hypothetical protein Tco_1472567 [Tanacetum coccineum]